MSSTGGLKYVRDGFQSFLPGPALDVISFSSRETTDSWSLTRRVDTICIETCVEWGCRSQQQKQQEKGPRAEVCGGLQFPRLIQGTRNLTKDLHEGSWLLSPDFSVPASSPTGEVPRSCAPPGGGCLQLHGGPEHPPARVSADAPRARPPQHPHGCLLLKMRITNGRKQMSATFQTS